NPPIFPHSIQFFPFSVHLRLAIHDQRESLPCVHLRGRPRANEIPLEEGRKVRNSGVLATHPDIPRPEAAQFSNAWDSNSQLVPFVPPFIHQVNNTFDECCVRPSCCCLSVEFSEIPFRDHRLVHKAKRSPLLP